MEIEIKYCNNLDYAKIILHENKLNIKFAPNGTGKSTIAKAIRSTSRDNTAQLGELMPFKFKASNPENKQPEILGVEAITKVKCFNEDYVNKFVFKKDELLSNSFDIFIRTEEYRKKEQEIEDLISEIKKLFANNPELETFISTLKEMGGAFKLTNTGLSKVGTGSNGLQSGNKIQHIPAGLEAFKPFINSPSNVSWIDWQTNGYKFFESEDNCPFCTSPAADKKEQIKRIGQEYNKKTIQNLVNIIDIIDRLGEYFSDNTKEKLKVITTLKDGLGKEHEDFLITVKKQIDTLVKKLENLKTLSWFDFQAGEKISETLPTYKLGLQFFEALSSSKTQEAIEPINTSIDIVIQKSGELQKKTSIQRRGMESLIKKHQEDINDFLAYAGYKYKVEIVGENERSQLKLLHIDHTEHLSGGNQHLSFGERNAFAIILFMYECLAKKPDLIILDDPISSFDKNKKYAILDMLFRREAGSCLKNKTVMMLTHDVEPIIDMVKSLSHIYNNLTSASFLKLSRGKITEQVIEKSDIKTFSQICDTVFQSQTDEIIKLIYLRRNYEISNEKCDSYQVLSNLFHKRTQAQATDNRSPIQNQGAPIMEERKFNNGCQTIIQKVSGFSYNNTLNKVSDIEQLKKIYRICENGYEKLQVFRLLSLNIKNPVIKKFINETYHIENEFICQLDPAKFDIIPEYVIYECDKFVFRSDAD